jgi:hypothetical protein
MNLNHLWANRPKLKRPILILSILILTAGLGYFIFEMSGFANGVRQDRTNKIKWHQDNTQIYFVDLPLRYVLSITVVISLPLTVCRLAMGGIFSTKFSSEH